MLGLMLDARPEGDRPFTKEVAMCAKPVLLEDLPHARTWAE